MAKKMLINALHSEEARVAIVEDGRLVDLDVEIAGNEQTRGNIYKGVVVRVEQGLQAAFVDIGLKKLGFLQMGELHPENWKWRDDIPEDQRHRRPRIQEVLRRGQELIVQVEKGERDNKGAALTTYVSLPGRYMVVMPGSDSAGISRKVESEGERKKLKEMISEMTIPEGYGYIIRTEAMGRTREELQKDFDSLVALYQGIREKGMSMKGAGMIYQESALIIRTIRDYFSADIDEVLVDSKDVYQDVREALKEIDPAFEKLVKMHQEKRPLFSRYQLEEQIDLIYEKKVPLKSGGSIFIEPTEALVSIDVNSGKSTGEKGVEDTAFKTNMEAAEEAARQLRLRDLGGLIVIDFIDMRDRKHNAEVEKTLKSALKADKARVNVARISEFGLLEMSRQRIRQTLNQASTLECPHCDGRGKVKSVEAMALSFLRKVHAAAAKGTIGEVVGSLPLEIAYYLLNRKRHELSRIENDYDIEVTVKGKPSYLLNQMDLELVKREKVEELPQEKVQPARPVAKEEAPAEAAADGRKKKKKGKKAAEPEVHAEAVPIAVVEEPTGAELVVTVEGEQEEHKKKRRRKRKRGKGGGADAAAHPAEAEVELPGDAGELAAGGAVSEPAEEAGAEQSASGEPVEEVKKKRRRKRRRGKGGHEAVAAGEGQQVADGESETALPVALAAEAAPVVEAAASGEAPAEKKPARKKRSRGKGGAVEAVLEAVVAGVAVPVAESGAPAPAAEPAAVPEKPAKKARPARKPKAAAVAVEAAAPAVQSQASAPAPASQSGAAESAAAPAAEAGKAEVAAKKKPARPRKATVAEPAAVAPAATAVPAAVEQAKPAKPAKAAKAKKAVAPSDQSETKSEKSEKAAKPAKAAKAAKPAKPAKAEPAPEKAPAAKTKAPTKRGGAKDAEPAAASEEKPKKPRAPRKKKEDTAV
ncbi:Rne/Rng family ribonuclease [Geomonas ferrireducens]|uniref:Rne/Rng family ribonuclease n=1 Tax=Geomonas ferrireducens TaxID=2570227 RepID=UPI0010A90715|nr:Rne/Rng family ribonuclease [Geomonas ferrireducens]